ncbi:ankyrin repeats (3 copies) domain-containing protein [Ditylenchus destructor]|uniref:Ankyrin repeats (3 copies) domain-containing protein n=1 Tax=Ditylenchus destructor TaxID=166010 RepID=A0AAD4MXX5_9BILA|nr:ankyrin repeats (3 copies) domain-containing protein [Ditylenchus destructor]
MHVPHSPNRAPCRIPGLTCVLERLLIKTMRAIHDMSPTGRAAFPLLLLSYSIYVLLCPSLYHRYRIKTPGICHEIKIYTTGVMINSMYIVIFGIVSAFISAVSSNALHDAVRNGSMFDLKKALRNCADLNPKDENDQTPLHIAVSNGEMLLTNILIEARVDLNAKDKNGDTPILIAVSKGEMLIAKKLIHAKADLTIKDKNGDTPILIAVNKGEMLISKALIEAKADVNVKDKADRTPLIIAMSKGELLISLALIEAKADVKVTDENDRTPLHLCILAQGPARSNTQQYRELKLKVVAALVNAGAVIDTEDKFQKTPVQIAYDTKQKDIEDLLTKSGSTSNLK